MQDMIEIMEESAGNAVGIRATGLLTIADYDEVLVSRLAELSISICYLFPLTCNIHIELRERTRFLVPSLKA